MKILVAVDESENSHRAVQYVGVLLRETPNVTITLFHVLKPMPRELLEHGGSENPVAEARLTYRYLLHESDRWRWRIGATAFIRDAKVQLRQAGRVATDSNIGFVPLLSTSVEYAIAPRWTAMIDLDGLVSTQGRAIDASAKIRYDLNDSWFVSAGYRVFEGGVDNDTYAFGWYNIALISLGARF